MIPEPAAHYKLSAHVKMADAPLTARSGIGRSARTRVSAQRLTNNANRVQLQAIKREAVILLNECDQRSHDLRESKGIGSAPCQQHEQCPASSPKKGKFRPSQTSATGGRMTFARARASAQRLANNANSVRLQAGSLQNPTQDGIIIENKPDNRGEKHGRKTVRADL